MNLSLNMQEFARLTSLLDNDFYKFTMQHGVIRLFPKSKVKYQFINRGKHQFPPGFAASLQASVSHMAGLRLTLAEKAFLSVTCPYLDPSYLDFLQGYQYNPDEVLIEQKDDDVTITIEGYWYRAILWEVPLLCLVSETYYKLLGQERTTDEEIVNITAEKIEKYKTLGITIAEFGTRRRHSYHVHKLVVETLRRFGEGTFVGSSNVHFAMTNSLKPIGTHAHEWFMYHAARYGFKMANSMALENWVAVYRGDLGIALADTYTSTVFYEQFDKMFTKLFDGVRHDSGDPLFFAEQTIEHYKQMGINPLSKTIVFSDALNYDKVARIADYCRGKIGMSFGIGTNLTNDVGLKPMNIVIKMVEALPEGGRWTPVVKLSDETGKYTGEPAMIDLAKQVLNIRE
ncbi:MAG: nicotinate phosphoribosyltransferase [Chitinophagaceae bacterium]|nr:nicotinate phosphoribosyltransferase [Chitinophagaceae bacterium]